VTSWVFISVRKFVYTTSYSYEISANSRTLHRKVCYATWAGRMRCVQQHRDSDEFPQLLKLSHGWVLERLLGKRRLIWLPYVDRTNETSIKTLHATWATLIFQQIICKFSHRHLYMLDISDGPVGLRWNNNCGVNLHMFDLINVSDISIIRQQTDDLSSNAWQIRVACFVGQSKGELL
jgi:hypothetical protein